MSRADIATPASAGALACRGLRTPGRLLDGAGSYMRFYLRAYAQVPRAVIRHRREIWRLLGEVAFGSGALAVIGGTVVTVGFLTSFAGIELGIHGYAQLSAIGVEALPGFVSASIHPRMAAPIIHHLTLVLTVCSGFSSPPGSLRASD